MKIATWNVNSLRVRLPHLLDWLKAAQPDVVGLQELKLHDEIFPHAEIQAAGYHAVCNGQKTYNGVALLSKKPAEDVARDIPGFDEQKRMIAGTFDGVRVISVYVPNGQKVGAEKYQYKLRWYEALRGWLSGQLAIHQKLAIVGDYNVAPADLDVHDPVVWDGKILCSDPERAALRGLIALGLVDTFRALHPQEPGYTWYDYRTLALQRNLGLRIDHILATPALPAKACAVDMAPRHLERPSDHAPVLAEF